MTQEQLARLAGVPASTVCHAEKGNISTRIGSLAKIARALNTTVDDLLVPADVIAV